jgi:hypothetical protein
MCPFQKYAMHLLALGSLYHFKFCGFAKNAYNPALSLDNPCKNLTDAFFCKDMLQCASALAARIFLYFYLQL